MERTKGEARANRAVERVIGTEHHAGRIYVEVAFTVHTAPVAHGRAPDTLAGTVGKCAVGLDRIIG